MNHSRETLYFRSNECAPETLAPSSALAECSSQPAAPDAPSFPLALSDELPLRSPHKHVVVFDVETQNAFDEVGGRENFDKLRVSVGVVFDEFLNEYFVYLENEMSQMIEHLFAADLVVGYNIVGFDYKVIQPYSPHNVNLLRTLDLMLDLYQRLGFRVKLDSVAGETLGVRKSGHGLQAIEWFRAGEMEKLTQYCKDDVKITYDLYRFGCQNGFVWVSDRGVRKRVLVDWGTK